MQTPYTYLQYENINFIINMTKLEHLREQKLPDVCDIATT